MPPLQSLYSGSWILFHLRDGIQLFMLFEQLFITFFYTFSYFQQMKWEKLCHEGECSIELIKDMSLATLDSLMKCIMGVEDDYQQLG